MMYRPSDPPGILIIDTTDRFGKRVFLEKVRFEEHIVVEHKEMSGNLLAIKESIENPYMIYQSAQFTQKTLYIAKSKNSSYPWLSVKTIVDQTNPDFGYVTTSFFIPDDKPGKVGDVIYDQKNTGQSR